MNLQIVAFLCYGLCSNFVAFGQNDQQKLYRAESLFQSGKYEDAYLVVEKLYQNDTSNLGVILFKAKIFARQFQKDSSTSYLNRVEKVLTKTSKPSFQFQYYLWRAYNYEVNKGYDNALENYFLAKKYIKEISDPYYTSLLFQRVLLIYSENDYRDKTSDWIDQYTKFKDSIDDDDFTNRYFNGMGKHYHHKKNGHLALKNFNSNITYSKMLNDNNMLGNAYLHKGIVFAEHLRLQDSARFYYHLSNETCNCLTNKLFQATSKYNIARTYLYDSNYVDTKKWLYRAWADTTDSRENYRRWKISRDFIPLYQTEENCDSALYFLTQNVRYTDSLNAPDNGQRLISIQRESYITEKEAELLVKEQKAKESQIMMYGLGGGLITVSLMGYLVFKNTKRKQRIAEQEKELEIQKTEKILKDQELTTIDAMIEGQEKERQRLASDLHDSVGATLSAARLQFDHISKNKDKLEGLDELFNKTGSLLEDAYNEVRSMAHVKNSGVIAKNGLLPAVQKLAKNASGASKLNISVEDFGLDNRLENTLEITIFRIIQELVTNIIKHANASEATISITQHKDSLSIIVEDNGRGFDAQKFQQNEGMGLSSIEQRIEHLEGTLEVDSTHDKGTSVLIDIPL